jgi:peptide/nickel transport system permease protein
MSRTVLRRLVTLVPLVWLVVTATFVVVHAAPGSYADTLEDPRLTVEAREMIRHRYGLDQPLPHQYLMWLGAVATGDLGTSFLFKEPVTRVIGRALPPTLLLTGTALLFDLALGLGIAMAAARRPYGWVDRVTTVLSLGVYGLPSFWIAGVAILVFAFWLGWFPPSHMHTVGADQLSGAARLADLLYHLVLPALCLGVVGAAATARYLRATLIETGASRFVLAARARGLPEGRILWVHTLRPSLLPLATLIGLSIPFLVSGSVVVESIFSWPGMGRILWLAAQARDVPLVLGVTLVGALAVVFGNLLADLLYAAVDPRVREQR